VVYACQALPWHGKSVVYACQALPWQIGGVCLPGASMAKQRKTVGRLSHSLIAITGSSCLPDPDQRGCLPPVALCRVCGVRQTYQGVAVGVHTERKMPTRYARCQVDGVRSHVRYAAWAVARRSRGICHGRDDRRGDETGAHCSTGHETAQGSCNEPGGGQWCGHQG